MAVRYRTKADHIRDQERPDAEKRAARESLVPLARREIDRLKPQVREWKQAREREIAAEQAELAAMTPAQLAAHHAKHAAAIPERAPEKPDFWNLAVEAVQWEDEAPEREQRKQRERALAPAQEKWERVNAEIQERESAAIREAVERRTESERAARELAQAELNDLGPRPVLSDYEVTV